MSKRILLLILTAGFVVFPGAEAAFAAHPLITDDAGTQGKGRFQFEFIGEYGHDEEEGVTTESIEIPMIPVLSYGITNAIDIVLGIPYDSIRTTEAGTTTRVRGITDVSVEMKWRFNEKDDLSFALKPGLTLPTGDENEGLGNGKATYSTFFITTKETGPWAFHLNLGYIYNEYKLQADEDANRKGIWHISLASEVAAANDLKAVANIGMERNPDKTSNTHPAFILGGLIYSIKKNFDIDFGVKAGINKSETDYSLLAGIVWRL